MRGPLKHIVKVVSIVWMLLLPMIIFAQKEGNIWHFGYNAGIDFNTETPTAINDGALSSREGCATACDPMGNLLFYSNGFRVWNRDHEVMPNGNDLMGNVSSTQSVVIVKKPESDSIFYVFTTEHQAAEGGFRYSVVDLTLDNGLGDVTEEKNVFIVTRVLEKITVIRHENYTDFWIVTHLWDSSRFHSYQLSSDGFDLTPVVSDIGSHILGNGLSAKGYLKASQDGDRIAAAHGGFINDAELFDFDHSTGVLNDPIIFDEYTVSNPYGMEFSPNGNLLYIAIEGEPGSVYQYNLLAGTSSDIKNSRVLIGTSFNFGGALQLAPDGMIYQACEDEEYLAVIEEPNILGVDCGYKIEGLYLEGKLSGIGLPNFANSYLKDPAVSSENVCSGDTTTFSINFTPFDSVYWDFGDIESGSTNNSTLIDPSHYYAETGSYQVKLISYSGAIADTLIFSVFIYSKPQVDLGNDTLLCQNEVLILDASTNNGYYQWQDGSTNPEFYVSKAGLHWVSVMANSCISNDSIQVEHCGAVFEMPNIFTPNNDAQNDFFRPIKASDLQDVSIVIYDRWGMQKYFSDDLLKGWDGKYKGTECVEGTYYWIIRYSDLYGREYSAKGYVSLLR